MITFVIKVNLITCLTKNNSAENIYVQSASLNGLPLNRSWIDYKEITAGGQLEIVLVPQPNKAWGLAEK